VLFGVAQRCDGAKNNGQRHNKDQFPHAVFSRTNSRYVA
jgi:hypothetical protein